MNQTVTAREAIGKASFSVSARVAMQLGRESISNSIVAILELVKNAYDADAENVRLYFIDLDGEHPALIIDDDGHGMTHEQIVNNWLVIGADYKLQTRRSPSKRRVFTGEKGLGRLGLDRLCAVTTVQTLTEHETAGLELVIDWRKYEGTNERLERIQHELYRLDGKKVDDPLTGRVYEKNHGTRLILLDLKDQWSDEALTRLRDELSLLVSPFAGLNDFAIWLAGRDRNEQVVSTDILEAAEWRLESNIDDQGYIRHRMTGRDGAHFDFSEHWSEVFRDTGTNMPRCGPVEFIMYFMPREAVEGLSFSEAQITSFLDTNQGIRIYRDYFRVRPYGDPSGEGDWLRLAYRRTRNPNSRGQSGWNVGYNQVVGAVFIEHEQNQALLDQTNREGIVDGPAFADLKRFATHAIEWFERRSVEAYRARRGMKRFEQAKQQAENAERQATAATQELQQVVSDAVRVLDTGLPLEVAPDLTALREQLVRAVENVTVKVEETIGTREEMARAHEEAELDAQREKDTLHNLASLGILAVSFGHETLRHSNVLVGTADFLDENMALWVSCAPDNLQDDVRLGIKDITYAAGRIHTFADFLLRNIRRDKRRRVDVYLDRVVRELLEPFDLPTTRGIQLEEDMPPGIPPTLGFVIDWESILLNFMTNSIWALRFVTEHERKIRVRLHQEDNSLRLSFADNGHGIEEGTIDHIFEPTFTTRRNERGDKIGTGMGLAIVDNLVQSYGARIRVESPGDLGGAEFHIYDIPISRRASRGRKK